MELYNIETSKGVCKCYEVKGVYHPLNETEADQFIGEDILSIEVIRENKDANI